MVVVTSLPPPTEGIRHKQENTSANIDGKDMGLGTLFITESCLSWTDTSGKGFSLQYPAISLHAVSRDLTAFPHECLYVMVNANLSNEPDGSDDETQEPITEMRFVPADKGELDAMFDAMAKCQALHPDEDDNTNSEDSENYEDALEVGGDGDCNDEWYTEAEGIDHLTEQGQSNLHRIENLLLEGANNPQNTIDIAHSNGQVILADTAVDSDAMETDVSGGQFDDASEADH
ncbi:methylosome subunit pICln-like [Saccoglossus kowalevskii]|uniref:Methylosome subunit pICln n=1 Tax=Saccoglossus kowalevskii TaxID=10224 RepID=A0ABM0H0I6_SACKO|nr:PREDICTED: methylosome subunit pICln-like [Saccoglossus kowalevskii]